MKNIYKTMNKLLDESKTMQSVAFEECLKYKDCQTLRKRQEEVYNKYSFYKGFIKAMNKKRSV